MMKNFFLPRGTNDILPDETPIWREIEDKARRILDIYGYKELRTPIFEETSLFSRSLGDTSDIVQKQMLNLVTNKENGLALRPEGTASAVRAYIQHNINKKQNLAKFYYIGPMFRGERPQKGRLRQFHHIGIEAIGISEPYLDAEVISLSVNILKEIGLNGFKVKINTLGSSKDKEVFSKLLREKLKNPLSSLCEDCQQRFERNVFRILDCKNDQCKTIVKKLDINESYLCDESQKYFSNVKEALKSLGITFEVEPLLVRGLDYYTHTVFEISHQSLGSQDALGAGGRYDNLVKELGGDEVGAVGFALGLERILLAKFHGKPSKASEIKVFIVAMGTEAYKRAFLILNDIRQCGISAEMSYKSASMKSQMRLSDKLGAEYVLIIGEDELKEENVTLKEMATSNQEKVALKNIVKELKGKLC